MADDTPVDSDVAGCEYDDADESIHPAMGDVLAAAEAGDVDALAGLLSQVGVDERGEDGDSALHIACLYGQQKVVAELLRRGARTDQRDEDDSTPLHDASAGGYLEIAIALLDAGADVAAVDSDGESPLHLACNGGHSAVASLLLERGADPSLANGAGMKPSDLAAADAPELARLVLAAADAREGK